METEMRTRSFPIVSEEVMLLTRNLIGVVGKMDLCYHENNTEGLSMNNLREMAEETLESIKTCSNVT